jgi:hypothetical protein
VGRRQAPCGAPAARGLRGHEEAAESWIDADAFAFVLVIAEFGGGPSFHFSKIYSAGMINARSGRGDGVVKKYVEFLRQAGAIAGAWPAAA